MTELFTLPFLTGLALAVLLPLTGLWLRLRDEWLAALAVAHLAGAGAVLALALALPALAGAVGLAIAGMLGRHLPASGHSAYAWLILAGWALVLLVAANSPMGETLARQLVEGQLYFTGVVELVAALVLTAIVLGLRGRIERHELALRLLPPTSGAERTQRRRAGLLIDTVIAAALAAGTLSIGLMATFALVFLPAWAGFHVAGHWRRAVAWTIGLGVLGYLIAFTAALALDQPFAPMLVAILLVLTTATRLLARRAC
ncbi:metal ABC transporter permease [Guyparkeria halophila]|uniref:Metal ABC transporter permease n=1 Tax=Guyparkeria halophila TaxID=47960 RepID=A0ABZ0YWR8_9GAMM|nr:metal ABC transporter permease [Guyparkeria halophila]WQH16604.1 metal ABC transporter permease [Guyparkeria halophila]